MLPYVFAPMLFVRAPAFSVSNFKSSTDFQFLESDFFRRALFFASPALFKQVKQQNFNPNQLKPGAQQSLLKYYNRMCFRATPFGLFSSFSSTVWSSANENLAFDGDGEQHINIDFRLSKKIVDKIIGDTLIPPLYFNPSAYILGSELRYLKSLQTGDNDSPSYGVSAVKYNNLLKELRNITRYGASTRKIENLFLRYFPDSDAREIVFEFINEELLFSSKLPNVTGENYLERIAAANHKLKESVILSSLAFVKTCAIEKLEAATEPIVAMNADNDFKGAFYVNYTRNVSGSLNKKHQNKLLEGLHCLHKLHESSDLNSLGKFRNRFFDKFEQQEISLMNALDPDVGIAYDGLGGNATDSDLLEDLDFSKPTGKNKINWGSVQGLLLNKIMALRGGHVIVLTDEDIADFETKDTAFSSGISLMFRIHDQKIFIESAGGAGATALIGRFTAFDEKALSQSHAICKMEQEANPDVIFAEIAFCPEEHAANINVRGHMYEYEIPIMVHSTMDDTHVIRLDELMVSVRGSELILHSSKLNKRIIPRMNSAYNHLRSELPVFRFLSDLQYQTVGASFTLNFEKLIPGLCFYPRVEYKECILCPMTWVLSSTEIRDLRDAKSFRIMATEKGIPRHFALSEADKQIVFDQQSDSSIETLLKDIRGESKIILKEFFMPLEGCERSKCRFDFACRDSFRFRTTRPDNSVG